MILWNVRRSQVSVVKCFSLSSHYKHYMMGQRDVLRAILIMSLSYKPWDVDIVTESTHFNPLNGTSVNWLHLAIQV